MDTELTNEVTNETQEGKEVTEAIVTEQTETAQEAAAEPAQETAEAEPAKEEAPAETEHQSEAEAPAKEETKPEAEPAAEEKPAEEKNAEEGAEAEENAKKQPDPDRFLKPKRAILKEAREALRADDWDPARVEEILKRFDDAEGLDTPAEQALVSQRNEIAERNEAKKKRIAEHAENAKKKRALVDRAKMLADSEDWKNTASAFKSLTEEWRAAGNAGAEGDALWEAFSGARQKFFDRQNAHYEQLNTQRADRVAAKEKIIEAAKEATGQQGAETDWKKIHERLEELLAEWKKIGTAGREDERLWEAFQNIRHAFYDRRTAARQEQEEAWKARREDKEALVRQAEAYTSDRDFSAEAAARMRDLTNEWKDIGFCGRKSENELWEKFHAAQDAYWQARKAAGASRHQEWVEKTRGAIDRRRDRIARIRENNTNLRERLLTAGEEKKVQINGWLEENERQIEDLEAEIARMEQELEKD